MTDWLKLHTDFINDPKLKRYFTKSERCDWINLLCLAKKSEDAGVVVLPDDEISFALELSDGEWESLCARFVDKRMIQRRADGAIVITNWKKRQYDKPSDAPEATAQRKREQREREKQVAECGIGDNNGVTPTQKTVTPCHAIDKSRLEEIREEEIIEEIPPISPKGDVRKRELCFLPEDWEPTPEMVTEAEQKYPKLDIQDVTTSFVDHWLKQTDPDKGRKLIWNRAWWDNLAYHEKKGNYRKQPRDPEEDRPFGVLPEQSRLRLIEARKWIAQDEAARAKLAAANNPPVVSETKAAYVN